MMQWGTLSLSVARYADWPSGRWKLRDKVTGETIPLAGKVIEYGIRQYETQDTDELLITSGASTGNRIAVDGDEFWPVISRAALEALPQGQKEGEPANFFHFIRITEAGHAEIWARGPSGRTGLAVYG